MWHYMRTLIASKMIGRFLFVLVFLLGLMLTAVRSNAAPATANLSTAIPVALNPDVEKEQRAVPGDLAVTGEEVSLSGWFTIIWGDGEPGSQHTAATYFLIDDSGRATELLLSEKVARSVGGVLALNRQRVVVEGTWANTPAQESERTAVHVQSLQPEAAMGAAEVTRVTNVVDGPQPWVSILCKFSDIAAEPKPLSYFQEMYGGSYPGLDHYWREQSYDIVNVGGSNAFGWYTLPQPRSYYVYGDYLDFERATEDCVVSADADVYFPDYSGVNLMFNADLGCCAWGGSWPMTLDGLFRYWNMTWEPPWGYENMTIMGHEMGHGFGLPHSSGSYGYVYDNQWDVMSDAWTNCYLATDPISGCLGQHTISLHKDMLGWIPAGQKYVATPGSSAAITLERLALPQSDSYKMAQIPIDAAGNRFYTVEVRQRVGYDVKLPGEGVVIHEVDMTRNEPAHVIDIDGDGDTGDDGAIWTTGETFIDSARGVSVSVDAVTATGYVVTIDFFSSPPPANDDFDEAIVIESVPYDNVQITMGATTAADDPYFECGSWDQGSASVWYRFIPESDGTLTINTEGSDYDTMLAIWTGSRGNLTSVGCDDDGGSGLTSSLIVNATAATTYYIEVAQYGNYAETPGATLALAVNFTASAGPTLSVPPGIPAHAGEPVPVPVDFTSQGTNIASTTFSINYDEACLAFDGSDSDQDGIPDAVVFNVPAEFSVAVTFNESDSDGELDFLIADTSLPLSALIDDSLVMVTFTATCQPVAETSTEVSVAFAAEPSASFGNTEGQSVPGTTFGGSVEILSGMPGDCNSDQVVDAGDISALVLEIFDGDGNDAADTAGGTFPGNVSCDANTDNMVDAGDISCVVLLIFNGPGACGGNNTFTKTITQPDLVDFNAESVGPELGIPGQVSAAPGDSVTVPITFTANDNEISSLIFSIDYDETWLSFDPTDGDGDGIPDTIVFNLPAAFSTSASFDNDDTKGELEFFIADLFPPLIGLPDGDIVYLTLKAADSPVPIEALVQFSSEPLASFGNTSGQSVAGTIRNGSVLITSQDFQVYLPSVLSSP